jgi:hypothetical protein
MIRFSKFSGQFIERKKPIVRECPQESHVERGNSFMLAYQFYCTSEDGENHLIAVLPERRRNSERITNRSILNWAREVIGNGCDWQSIYFVEVNPVRKDVALTLPSL